MAEATTTINLQSTDVVEASANQFSFTVYPNPTQNLLHIDLNLQKNELLNIYITDITGKSIIGRKILP